MTALRSTIENHGARSRKVSFRIWITTIGPDLWVCPVCCGTCNCSQCARRKNKEITLKSQFLAQFEGGNTSNGNKRTEKE